MKKRLKVTCSQEKKTPKNKKQTCNQWRPTQDDPDVVVTTYGYF